MSLDLPASNRRSKQTSCFACMEAKRRCDKALPSCSRCVDKDIDCRYPPPKRRQQQQQQQNHGNEAPISGPGDAVVSSSNTFREQRGQSSAPPLLIQPSGDLRWFLHPSAWNVAYHYEPPMSLPSSPAISNFIRGVQAWLLRFLCDGHNPFIHRLLYQAKTMPQCMQDAYAAIAISQHVTSENEHMIDNTSSSLISKLLSSQPADGSSPFTITSSKDHLARTHALLIYLLLGLFSPSIRRRAEAENLIETVVRLTNQLWQAATQDTITAPLFQTAVPLAERNEFYVNLHELFAICESIRRTWILGNLATGIFRSLKGDWTAACAGDIHTTMRAELWEATSLARWETIVSEKDPLFIYSLNGESLLIHGVHASQVDEFARHIFTIMWEGDKVEHWIERTRDGMSWVY
ncbi:hypothetical protein NW762_008024 [Fusarium torreyae]|uniref:Zn(2)-C6 fungal-type domain-containing protein n=1 Tax=Fusarium torreyae TaxID=1237075 RepID=A0A9W8RZZ0_9HYPO|nr:hypothetical protein NW762_008024 [Fusarium torreyae]